MSISEQLRAARKAAGKSAAESTRALKLTVHAYRRYERGEVEPRVSQAVALAEFFEITLDELLTDKPSVDSAQRMIVSVQPGQRILLDVTGVTRPELTKVTEGYKTKVELHDKKGRPKQQGNKKARA